MSLAHTVIEHGPALNTAARLVLAATDPTVNDNSDNESKKSGPIGIAVIIVLCVACYFLFKSLSKHLRQVRNGEVPVSAPPPVAPARTPPAPEDEDQPDPVDRIDAASLVHKQEPPPPAS